MKIFNEVPNLDAMNLDELYEFKCFLQHKELACMNLMGHCKDESPIIQLWTYTINKRSAIKHRLNGSIPDALECESVCDSIYKHLPDNLQW